MGDRFIGSGYRLETSTDCDQGDGLVAFIVDLSHRIGIERRHAVHEKLVLMVAMGKLQPDDPPAIRHAFHGMHFRLPSVEVTNEADTPGLGCPAEEIHQVQRTPR